MLKKVSADTVTELTINSGFSPGSHGAQPTAQQMIDKIRAELTMRVEALDRQIKQSKNNPKSPPTAFQIAYPKAVKELEDFEKIIASIPNGFRLEPVLYSKIDQAQNAKVYSEYSSRVRPDFMYYLAHNHATELAGIGICQHGIEMMKKGLDPTDQNGHLYSVNVDHIVERSGGGNWSLQKAVDPQMPAGRPPTYLVNHFTNFVLLPKAIHNLKNELNNLQKSYKTPVGESTWVLMLVPETGPGQSAYIAAPQGQLHSIYGAQAYQKESSEQRIRHAEFMADRVRDAIDVFREIPPQQSLSQVFNSASAPTPEQQARLDTFVKPAIQDLTWRLKAAFDGFGRSQQGSNNHKAFIDLYQGRTISVLRKEMAGLPIGEAVQLNELFKEIDTSLQARFNKNAPPSKPSNDNRTSTPYRKKKRRRHYGHKHRHH